MNKEELFKSRLNILSVLVFVMIVAILLKMIDKQIVHHGDYLVLAQGQQRFEQIDLAQRGRVFVHSYAEGEDSLYPLAFDVKSFSLWAVPKQIVDKSSVANEVSQYTDMSKEEVFSKINNDKLYIPPLKRGLDYTTATEIKEKEIGGIYVMPEYNRYYPEGTLASQVLGFVNAEGKGNYGFEGHYDYELRGTSGKVVGEKDTLGRVIALLSQENASYGTSYILSIDRSVQFYVEKVLDEEVSKYQAEGGTVVVMDVKSGGVVAMANSPDFDPNEFRKQADQNQDLFANPAIAHTYEPGSVFKPIIMAAALDSGAVDLDTKETFSNFTVVDGYEIHTAEDKAFGEETMTQILENSDNVGMVWVADKVGNQNLHKYISKFGFLDKTNIDLDTEASGYTQDLKLWRDINRATIGFGQGISVTPIEIVCAYAAIANGGRYIYPHLVDEIIMPDGSHKKVEKREGSQMISEQTANQLTDMLISVVENGHAKKAKVEGFKVAGKTGTAQIPNPDGGYFEDVFIHTFTGFAPADDPQFVVLIKLNKPRGADFSATTTAPIFSKITAFLLNYYYRIPAND